ncbi:hypothetical protein BC830DRAFT_1215797 [Chytriomyces sp. MP71]|nr:hypothetical protein BC830DRAFT_1215797 [Chytriomyces sp. MP71]
MSQSSRRAWNQAQSGSGSGGGAASQVRGPTSALSSFLRERGINTGRLNPYARLPNADPNNNANAETEETGIEANLNAEESSTAQPATAPTQTATTPVTEQATSSSVADPLALLTYEATTTQKSTKTTKAKGKRSTAEAAIAEAVLNDAVNEAKLLDFDDSINNPESNPTANSEPPKKKTRKELAAEKKSAAATQKKEKEKAKGKGKRAISDSEDDGAPGSNSNNRSAHSKRNTSDKDSILKFCTRCLRKFIPAIDGEDTCVACLTIPKAGKGGTTGGKKIQRKRAVLAEEAVEGQVTSLKDMCIKLVADNIDCVEAFGEVPDDVKRSISRILSKRRLINYETINLFIGPEEKRVELFDCARLKPDSFNQIIFMCPNLQVLHLADCGQLTDPVITTLSTSCPSLTSLTLKGAFLVTDAAFETLFSSSAASNLRDLALEHCAKLGSRGIAALVGQCVSGLRSLRLSICSGVKGGEAGVIDLLGHFTSLESLELNEIGQVTDDELIILLKSVGPGLLTLALTGFPSMTDAVPSLGLTPFCPNLHTLSLARNEQLTDAGLHAIFHPSPTAPPPRPLIELNLTRLYNLTDATARALAALHGPTLRTLSLNGVDDLTRDALQALLCSLPRARELDLSWVRCFDDALFELLLGACKGLHVVKVYGCNLLTEFSLLKRWENGEGEVVRVIGNEFD